MCACPLPSGNRVQAGHRAGTKLSPMPFLVGEAVAAALSMFAGGCGLDIPCLVLLLGLVRN